jgi:uncharacterized protein (TIGR02996 family)
MPTEADFIATIKDADQLERDWHPPLVLVNSDEPRLVFSDWLEERGDRRSELIRVQIQIEEMTEGQFPILPESPQGQRIARLQETKKELIPRLSVSNYQNCKLIFRRGFVEEIVTNDPRSIDQIVKDFPLIRRIVLTKRPIHIDMGAGQIKYRSRGRKEDWSNWATFETCFPEPTGVSTYTDFEAEFYDPPRWRGLTIYIPADERITTEEIDGTPDVRFDRSTAYLNVCVAVTIGQERATASSS